MFILKKIHYYQNLLRYQPKISPPNTLNFFANNVCNSRCKMCSVWKRKSQKQLTPQELATILDNSLFRELKYIGVSGGEPTLREDLAEIFQVIVSRKGLQRTGIITNAIEADSVINQLDKCYHICRKANVPFNVMVSLDGVGKIHEIVRGKKGSFEQAIKVIRHLRDNTDIPLTVACTVIKENVWNIDEVLAFCKKENVYVRFRVAEYIDRLYNEDCKRSIRNFDDDERYQIALFFSKLELSYEKSRNIIETYKNIRKMVYDDSPRQSGCPYQKNAICLDSVGNLLFCSPKSPIIGSCLEQSAKKIYIKNIHLQDEIINRYCPNCIHDYHAPPTKESLKKEKERNNFRRQMRIKESLSDSKSFSINSPFLSDWSTFKKSFIIGWYGTETAGDKPILASIVKKIKDSNPEAEISVSSLYPFITRRTLYELGLTDLRIVNTFSPAYLETCRIADAIIMGGGPLMNIESLGIVLTAFKEGCKRGIPTIIEGCGIGPLSSEKHRLAVKEILRLSTEIKVRDTASLAWVIENTGRTDATYTPDPAVSFVEDWKKMNLFHLKEQKKDYFGCFFREITPEYAGEMTPTDPRRAPAA